MQPQEWITVNGNHIPIMPGQSKDEAVKEFLANKESSTSKPSKPKQKPKDAERVYAGIDQLGKTSKITSKSTDKQVVMELAKDFIPIYEAEGEYYCKHGAAKVETQLTETDIAFARSAIEHTQNNREQAKVLSDYKSNGYQIVNHYLRTGETGFRQGEQDIKDKVREYDKAIKGYEVKEPMTLYRGMSKMELDFWSGIEVGKQEKVVNYLSTSPSEEVADTFSDDSAKIKIIAPKGKDYGVPMQPGVMTQGERVFEPEFLLRRGTVFKRLPDENGALVFEVIL